MTNQTKDIPHGPRAVTPYLTVSNGDKAIEFYRQAFGAIEIYRLTEPGGKIGHAEIEINGMPLMLSDEYPEIDVRSPQTLGGSPVGLHLYVEDADTIFSQAVAAGATVINSLKEQFGLRIGKLTDPFGHVWYIATVIEDLSPQEIVQQYDTMIKQAAEVGTASTPANND